jgi:hypothetical protein
MPFANPSQLDPIENDAVTCVKVMRPELQRVIDQRPHPDALVCAMTLIYAQLIHACGGRAEPLTKAMTAFTELPRPVRKQAQRCFDQITELIAETRRFGFSADAVMYSLIDAITNTFTGLGRPQAEVDQCMTDMIEQLNYARRLSIN